MVSVILSSTFVQILAKRLTLMPRRRSKKLLRKIVLVVVHVAV